VELTSIHPIDLDLVRAYVALALEGVQPNEPRLPVAPSRAFVETTLRARERASSGDEAAANILTHGLGQVLAASQPSFFHQGLSLTAWEARIDRGIGMLMRPPARLFIDAGFDVAAARAMPTRLDLSRGMMGGAFIPARLIPDLEQLLERRLERSTRRLIDAELDPVAVLGLMFEMARYARQHNLGLYEAIDVVTPDHLEALPPGAQIVVADRKRIDPALKKRIEIASKPAKKPSIFAKMLGKGARSGNGRASYPQGGEGGNQ
jgi:hypothetical protein